MLRLEGTTTLTVESDRKLDVQTLREGRYAVVRIDKDGIVLEPLKPVDPVVDVM